MKNKWNECCEALTAADHAHHAAVREITYAVCIENRRAESLTSRDFGDLRIGLNAPARVFGFAGRTEDHEGRARGWGGD